MIWHKAAEPRIVSCSQIQRRIKTSEFIGWENDGNQNELKNEKKHEQILFYGRKKYFLLWRCGSRCRHVVVVVVVVVTSVTRFSLSLFCQLQQFKFATKVGSKFYQTLFQTPISLYLSILQSQLQII